MNKIIKYTGIIITISVLALALESCNEDTKKSTSVNPRYQISISVAPDTDINGLTSMLGTSIAQTGSIQDSHIKITVTAKQINAQANSDIILKSKINKVKLPFGVKSTQPAKCQGNACSFKVNTENYMGCSDAHIDVISMIGDQEFKNTVPVVFDKSKPWFVTSLIK